MSRKVEPITSWAEFHELAAKQNELLNYLKGQQENRGEAKLLERYEHRMATRNTIRQMKRGPPLMFGIGGERGLFGINLMAREMRTPGNYPFAIGFGIISALNIYMYFRYGVPSEEARKESAYYGRYMEKYGGTHIGPGWKE